MKLKDLVLSWQEKARDVLIPGVAIAVLDQEKPIWSTGFGMANADRAVSSNTVFEAASLSKQVVALAAFNLCQMGLLELDKPLIEYLPDPNLGHDAHLGLITTRHVLSHTSGLPNWLSEGEMAVTTFQPGERFSYSGIGFQKLQKVIEQITNLPLEEYLQKTVFKPLNMQNSSFVWHEDFATRAALGHDENGMVLPKYKPSEAHAAYSLHSTVLDLAKFLQEFLHSATLLEMLKPQILINQSISWGLGWGLETCETGQFCWQWGNNSGFRSLMVASRGTGFGVVVLTNGANGDMLWKPILEDLTCVEHPALTWLEDS